jgi:quinol monooxygenase YgiN
VFGLHVRFTTQPGQAGALASILLEAAAGLERFEECLLYLVSRSPDDEETVFVTEAWTSREAHAASLEGEDVKGLVGQAMPLLAGPPERTELRPLGGKGVP